METIRIEIPKLTLMVGQWFKNLSYSIMPFNDEHDELVWYSDDPKIATVSSTTGYIYANSPGTTEIHVRLVRNSNCKASIMVTVYEPISTKAITFDQTELYIRVGECLSIIAKEDPPRRQSDNILWASSNVNVARVVDGVICGISNGSAIITALL